MTADIVRTQPGQTDTSIEDHRREVKARLYHRNSKDTLSSTIYYFHSPL